MKNTVLVGMGAISPLHAEPVFKMGYLYGVCDIIKSRADENAKKYNCRAYYDFKDVLADENTDCVHIMTPHYLHFPMALAAAKAGKTVVMEKPAVLNMKEFNELSETFEKYKTKNLIVLQNRYNPCITYLREHFDEIKNELGEFLGSKGILTWERDKKYYSSGEWRGKYETEGGGLLINQAPHMIDLLLWFGGELESFEGDAHLRVLKDIIEVEDTCEAVFNFKNKTRSVFYGTNGYVINSPYDMEFAFERGVIRYAYDRLFMIKEHNITVLCEDIPKKGEKCYWGNGHKRLFQMFYGGEKCTSLADYKTTCEVLEKLINTRRSKV